MSGDHLDVGENSASAAAACAEWILSDLRDRLKSSARVSLALSGGTTPKLMFNAMAETPFDWSRVHVFWVDERCVPPDDALSNYKLANEHLLRPAGIPEGNIHRIRGEIDPERASAEYAADIVSYFGSTDGRLPSFDVIHRGMGSDAHTASLFPGDPLIADRKGIAAHVFVEKLKMHRVTLLPGVLLAARKTAILAAGEDKAEALFDVLLGEEDAFRFPCQLAARGAANAFWFVDRDAAAKLQ